MEERLRTYGLVGKKLNHSFSPNYFRDKFIEEEIENAQYLSFSLEDINEFRDLIIDYNLSGLNVTIPYKESVIQFLDQIDPLAAEIGAVNCISMKNNKLKGYNTDIIGFEHSLRPLLNEVHSNAIILGTGGAAKAVAFVLEKLGITYNYVSRQKTAYNLSYTEAESALRTYPLIINTTPVGTSPNHEETPLNSLKGIGENHLVYDLIYNPEKTALLKLAEQQGARIKNGLEMLEIQAEESWKIWNK